MKRCHVFAITLLVCLGLLPSHSFGQAPETQPSEARSEEEPEPPTPDNALSAETPSQEGPPPPVALAVRGGISLGVYQAGVNWVLLKMWKARRDKDGLAAVTGASAGNINVLVMATEWCRKEDPSTLWDNYFWDTWGYLGFWTELYPLVLKDSQKKARSLFNRDGATQYIEKEFKEIWSDPEKFDAECKLKTGIAISKLDPFEVRDERTGKTLSMVRTASNLEVSVHPKAGLQFKNIKPSIGSPCVAPSTVHFMLEEGGTCPELQDGDAAAICYDTIFQLSKASSAFPVAFAPVRLKPNRFTPSEGECKTQDEIFVCQQDPDGSDKFTWRHFERGCSPEGTPDQDGYEFFDGGAFDTLPIPMLYEELMEEEDADYVFLDTDITRSRVASSKGAADGYSLVEVFEHTPKKDKDKVELTIPKLIGVAKTYFGAAYDTHMAQFYYREKQTFDKFTPTTRLHSLYGDYLGKFAAFLGFPMREFDYLVGVYDGIIYWILDETPTLQTKLDACKAIAPDPKKRARGPNASCREFREAFELKLDAILGAESNTSLVIERQILMALLESEIGDKIALDLDAREVKAQKRVGLARMAEAMFGVMADLGESKSDNGSFEALDFFERLVKPLTFSDELTPADYSRLFCRNHADDKACKKALAKELEFFTNTDFKLRKTTQDILNALKNSDIFLGTRRKQNRQPSRGGQKSLEPPDERGGGLSGLPVDSLLHTFNSRVSCSAHDRLRYRASSVPCYESATNKTYRAFDTLFIDNIYTHHTFKSDRTALRLEFLDLGLGTAGKKSRWWFTPSPNVDLDIRSIKHGKHSVGFALEVGRGSRPQGTLPGLGTNHLLWLFDLSVGWNTSYAWQNDNASLELEPFVRVYFLDKFFINAGVLLSRLPASGMGDLEDSISPSGSLGVGIHDLPGIIYLVHDLF